jgi:3-oxoacyl-[acyl-carrier-protein] synthase-3
LGIDIIGTGRYLPGRPVTNDEIYARCDDFDVRRAGRSLDDWAVGRIGVRTRHRAAPGEGTAAMAAVAARRALAMAGVAAADVDLIVLATFTSDHRLPQSVCTLQAELGAQAKCLQLESACTGFVDAMLVASSLLEMVGHRTAIVVHSEAMSAVMDPRRFLVNTIFGDGAGAVVLRRDPDSAGGLLGAVAHTDGTKAFWLEAGGGTLSPVTADRLADGRHLMTFDHRQLVPFAVEKMAEACREVLGTVGHDLDDVDVFVAHQTGTNILQAVAERLGVDPERFLVTIDHTGNTSGATIPIALDELNRAGRLRPGQRVLMPSVGAGMAWGALYASWTAAPVPASGDGDADGDGAVERTGAAGASTTTTAV